MMKISTYNSRKIAVLNAVAILMVLLLHSYYIEAADYPTALWVQRFTGTLGLSGVAVPLFYLMSGLLFFKSVTDIKDCIKGIRKRVHSLFVPYVLWNVIFVGWYVVMHYTPGVSQFVNSDMLSHFSLEHPVESLKYLLVEPAGFQLWFLRDLMVYVAFTPLLWILMKRFPWLTLAGLYLVFGGVARCGITFFALGGLIAMHYSLDDFSRWVSKPVVIACNLLFLTNAVMAATPATMFLTGNSYWQQCVNTVGIIAVWGLYDMMCERKGQGRLYEVLLFASKYCFFIYLFHEPAFNIIKKLSLKIVGVNDCSLIVFYLVNPLVMAVVALAIGMCIKKLMPKVYGVLVGGR